MSSKDKINHKELLTFSNLTNLEWEFADLEPTEKTDEDGNIYYEYEPLKDLLDPEMFYEEDEDGNVDRYIYGEDESGNFKEERGFRELREEAGIAMEYLEHSGEDEEGEFIKDWEVIYGADNYKVVKDYLDYKWSRIAGQVAEADEEAEIYPSREEVKENERWQARLQFIVDMGELLLSIKGASAPKESLSSLVSDVNLFDLTGKFTGNLSKEYGALAIGAGLVFNVQDPAKILKQSLGLAEQKILKGLTEELEANAPGEIPDEPVKINENLDMRDTGFRVVAFKKDDQIVVAYKGGAEKDKQGFPREFELLQLVYSKLKRENSEAEINFTGYNRGADLSFINNLFVDQREKHVVEKGDTLWDIAEEAFGSGSLWKEKLEKKDGTKFEEDTIYPGQKVYYYQDKQIKSQANLFYTDIEKLKDYLYFLPENLGKEYKSFREIYISEVNSLPAKFTAQLVVSVGAAVKVLISGGSITGMTVSGLLINAFWALVVASFISLMSSQLINYIGQEKQDKVYDKFKELKFIREEKEGITGYITDEFFRESIEVKAYEVGKEQPKTIEVEPGCGIYIKAEDIEEEIQSGVPPKLVIRNKDYEEPSLFITLQDRNADFLRLVKDDNGVYKFNSVVVADINRGQEETDEANENFYNFVWNEHALAGADVEEKEWGWEPLYEVKNKIQQLQAKNEKKGLTDEETKELSDLKEKKKAVQAVKSELSEYETLIGLMEIIADMQRNYQNKAEESLEFIYPSDDKEKRIKIANEIPEQITENDYNQFAFMPYIQQDNGALENEIRAEYITSAFKSAVQSYLEFGLLPTAIESVRDLKYSLEKENNYTYDFDEEPVNDELMSIIDPPNSNFNFADEIFNHGDIILEKLDGNLDSYYDLKSLDTEDSLFGLFNEITGKLVINSGEKGAMEYKYNPDDHIIGGKLKVLVSGLADEALEEKEEVKRCDQYDQGHEVCKVDQAERSEEANVKLNEVLFYS